MSGPKPRFNEAEAAVILARISDGESLRSVCSDPDMPSAATVCLWARGESGASEAFAEQYARARDCRADFLFDQITDLADEATNEDVNIRRLQIDSRKFTVARMAPKKYGEKSQVDMNVGGQADTPAIAVKLTPSLESDEAIEVVKVLKEVGVIS